MASQNIFCTPAVERPTVQQLQALAEKLHLHITPSDLEQHKDVVSQTLSLFDRLEKLNEPTLPTKYPTTAGYQPPPAQNPYNAWARITNIAGAERGKLTGKKVAVKDNINITGVPMLNGSHFMRGFVSSCNATVINRVLDEGGFIKGKATCENLCISGSSFCSAGGPVLNPYDITRSAGGSSSGNAVLVATGEVDMAIGTDQGGSIRLPSCWCGIVGFKPTYGLIPYTGIAEMEGQLDHCGPMARTVHDCALLLEVIAGRDGLDARQPSSMTVPAYSKELTGDVTGLRVGLLQEGFEGCEADVEDTVRKAAMSLSQCGVTVKEFSFPLHTQASDIARLIFMEGMYDTYTHGGLTALSSKGPKDTAAQDFMLSAAQSRADSLPISLKNILLMMSYVRENYGCHFYSKAINVMRDISAAFDELFKVYDVIIMPTIKFKPHQLLTEGPSVKEFLAKAFGNTQNTFGYNVTGNPALTINAGYSIDEPRLPIGMMLVGRNFDDVTVLRLAHAFERLRDSSPDYAVTVEKLTSKFQSMSV